MTSDVKEKKKKEKKREKKKRGLKTENSKNVYGVNEKKE